MISIWLGKTSSPSSSEGDLLDRLVDAPQRCRNPSRRRRREGRRPAIAPGLGDARHVAPLLLLGEELAEHRVDVGAARRPARMAKFASAGDKLGVGAPQILARRR